METDYKYLPHGKSIPEGWVLANDLQDTHHGHHAVLIKAIKKVQIGDCILYLGDCMQILPSLGEFDAVITDPPYGVTALKWDKRIEGWEALIKTPHLWVFGSLRFFLNNPFNGWTYGQEIIWEKHNGSNMLSDRFKRVHEIAIHLYKGEWKSLYKNTVCTPTAQKNSSTRRVKPGHFGEIKEGRWETADGDPAMVRSVIYSKSCHGYAEHPTQKPLTIIEPLIEYSCPEVGSVLDPFMGSGTTGVACVEMGRKFTGIELNPEYFEIACKRIAAATRQPSKFVKRKINHEN